MDVLIYGTDVTNLNTLGNDTITPTTISPDVQVLDPVTNLPLTGPFDLSGNDTIYGYGGTDTIDGGAGDDTIDGGADNDTIDGGANNDTVDGGDGNDIINGGDGNDILDGGDGDDNLNGGMGDDTIDSGAGNDIIDGGDGSDTAGYSSAQGSVFIDLSTGTVTSSNPLDGTDSLISIENALGGEFNDTIMGSSGNNVLAGGDGDDIVIGGAGDDTLYGDDTEGLIHRVHSSIPQITAPIQRLLPLI
jgi:Ca2+-binding RTX toxin-like protein